MASTASKIEEIHFGVKSSSLFNPTKQKISQEEEQQQQHGGQLFVISPWKCLNNTDFPPKDLDLLSYYYLLSFIIIILSES